MQRLCDHLTCMPVCLHACRCACLPTACPCALMTARLSAACLPSALLACAVRMSACLTVFAADRPCLYVCPSRSASMDRVRIFFNAGYASVASTGAWPGRGGTGCCDGAWPGVTRAWPGSKIWKLLSRHKGQVGSDIKELLDELQSCFLCALMVSICKGLAKRPKHSRSISHKACPGNPPGKCNEGFESALGSMITHKSHGHRMRSTLARPAPSVSCESKSLAQWVAQ